MNEVNKGINHILLENDNNKNKLILSKEYKQNFFDKESSIISKYFHSQTISIYSCQCNHELYAFQFMMYFPLLIPENKFKLELMELLEYNFTSEKINFGTKCSKCHKIFTHLKQLKIAEPPIILILSLQGFNRSTNKKNNCFVTFHEILSITKFIDKECGFQGEATYILYGIINHVGTISSGHYYSYVKIIN